jgi:hypothetical protein
MAKAKMDRSAFVGKLLEEQDGDTPRSFTLSNERQHIDGRMGTGHDLNRQLHVLASPATASRQNWNPHTSASFASPRT